MKLELTVTNNNSNSGAFGLVVSDVAQKWACKVFKKCTGILPEITEEMFNSEVKGYEAASRSPIVQPYVPQFFGNVKVSRITNEHGLEVSHLYYLNFSFKMEYILGQFFKLADAQLLKGEKERVERIFTRAGILHFKDVCVTVTPDHMIEKVIDFAIREIELEHPSTPDPW